MPTKMAMATGTLGLVLSLQLSAGAQLEEPALKTVRSKIQSGYGATVQVNQSGKRLQVLLETRSVSASAYTGALAAVCVHLGQDAKKFIELAILNKFGAQGYIYEMPARCGELANGKMNDRAVMAATHLR